MKPRKAFLSLLMLWIFSSLGLGAQQRDYLEREDVRPIMTNILEQHIDYRYLTPEIIKRSLKLYIDQFDSDRLYLLKEEVRPYLEIGDEEAFEILERYRQQDFSVYEDLNALIQAAIYRARATRSFIKDHLEEFAEESQKSGALRRGLTEGRLEKQPFSKNEEELQRQVKDDFIRFFAAQRYRLGKESLKGKEHKVFALYERRLRSLEKKYLFHDEHDRPLSSDDAEHYFVLHILKALASSLDAHTAFFDAGEAYDMRVRLEKGFQGIGVVLQESIEGVTITKLIEGGPAQQSGLIKVNDRLVEVDGQSIIDTSFRSILDLIRGEEGSTVSLGIRRRVEGDKEKFLRVEIKRESVVVRENRVDVDHRELEDGIIGIVRLHSFYEGDNGVNSESDVRQALKDLHSKGRLKGLILDLRENTGGFLSQAVKVAGLFISNGVVVVSRYSGDYERVFRDIDGYTYYNGPLIVLTSRTSASAAEIVAQALQDYGAAIVVGDEQSYGKGTIQHQTITNESSTSFFKVTVGRFYTVSGRSTQIRGVEADIVVPSVYHREHIGEEFLDFPLNNDYIESSYADDLDDIAYSVREWFRDYYLPTVQKKNSRWEKMLPQLRVKSAKRVKGNIEFQQFISKTGDEYEAALLDSLENFEDREAKDLQLEETVNILKDMIHLKSGFKANVGQQDLRASQN